MNASQPTSLRDSRITRFRLVIDLGRAGFDTCKVPKQVKLNAQSRHLLYFVRSLPGARIIGTNTYDPALGYPLYHLSVSRTIARARAIIS